MSQENVELAQRFSKAFERASRAYWKDPRSLEDGLKTGDLSPEAAELMSYLHPEVEWKTAFSLAGETRRGHIEFARFCDEWLDATEDYAVTVRDVTDLEDDRVFIVSDLAFKGKGTGIEVNGVSLPWSRSARASSRGLTNTPAGMKRSKPPVCRSRAMSQENVENAASHCR